MRPIVRAFDTTLARALGVFEFTQDPGCILRLQHATLRRRLVLRDAEVAPGARVLVFHLWNERIPLLPVEGADLTWARQISRSLIYSFRLVHSYVVNESRHASPQAIGGITVLGVASGTADILAHFGFTPHPYPSPLGRFGEWWENAYTWTLMWAYNPASLRGKRLSHLHRTEYWMSISTFLDRFAAA